jgi:hypothetical protein
VLKKKKKAFIGRLIFPFLRLPKMEDLKNPTLLILAILVSYLFSRTVSIALSHRGIKGKQLIFWKIFIFFFTLFGVLYLVVYGS